MSRFAPQDTFDPRAKLASLAQPAAATAAAGNITLDVDNGNANTFLNGSLDDAYAMSGSETLLDPVDMPVGWTIYFYVDPGTASPANVLSFAIGFVAPTPEITTKSLIAITQPVQGVFLAAVYHAEDPA